MYELNLSIPDLTKKVPVTLKIKVKRQRIITQLFKFPFF